MTALDTTLAMCSTSGFKFSQLPMKQREIAKFMSDTLDAEWKNNRGIEIMSVALAKVTPDDTSRERIEEFDTNMMHSDPTAMTGGLAYAQMKAMRDAASNEGGAMTGFMGFGMAANAMGGVGNQGTLINTAKDLAKENENKTNESHANDDKVREADDQGNTLTCACGHVFEGKFCPECGMPAPAPKDTWLCPSCGRSCTGKFCRECGTKEPVDETWACPACKRECKGKFCPDCGAKRP